MYLVTYEQQLARDFRAARVFGPQKTGIVKLAHQGFVDLNVVSFLGAGIDVIW